MLRPERMSKVSVAGSRQVMGDVIEAIHDLQLVHFSDYDGDIEGFDTGSPLEGAEEASDKLVTVRSLKSILDVTEEDAGPTRIVTDEALERQLEDIRITVNERDDRRATVESELNAVADRIEAAEPFVELGIDLDLLQGYESLEVVVGEGDVDAVESALEDAEAIDAHRVFTGDGVFAAFAYPEGDADGVLDDVLVGVEIERLEIPDETGDPESYLEELRHERQRLESKLERIQAELKDLRLEYAGFLLAAEETLTIAVQKREIPLQFATTEHAFVAEGWIPAERYGEFETTVMEAADGRVDVDQIAVADHREYAPSHADEDDGSGAGEGGGAGDDANTADTGDASPTAETGKSAEVAADGGAVEFESGDQPPVILDNPKIAKPFELLVRAINRPRYWEVDPTVILLLTFPAFFGFMIGDVGYGLLYAGVGYALISRTESDGLRSLGGIAVWSGAFTVLFGILYGEIFGLHLVGDVLWGGHPPMHKGLQPNFLAYAQAWLFLTLFIALIHLTVGYLLGFVNELPHGPKTAFLENGSWAVLMLGLWTWIFSRHAAAAKPDLLYAVFNREGAPLPGDGTVAADQVAYALGFGGFPEVVGLVGLVAAGVGFVLLLLGEGGVGALESLNVLVNVLSYTRIAAVLLAKAGMAFVVNLLFFGVYVTGHGEDATWHFGLTHMPHVGDVVHGHEVTSITFGGLLHSGAAGVIAGIVILVLGHLLVLALGITSAGLQAVRLEYVEFFGKFYEGGGSNYEPFGYTRRYTTED
ncbi:MAG: V-type ATP synthase subunit I [Halodesulfurarchaeum sp.]